MTPDQIRSAPSNTTETIDLKLSFPTAEHLPKLENKKLAELFLENHRKLLVKVRSLELSRVPYFGLHGLKEVEDLGGMIATERPYFQVVTALEKSKDPVVFLNDLYDVVGGDSHYFNQPQNGFVVVNLEKDGKSMAHKWGDKGEAKNWGWVPSILSPEFFKKDLGLHLSVDIEKFFEYFRTMYNYQELKLTPHAQKSQVPMSGKEMEERIMASYRTSETNLYLSTATYMTEANKSPENWVRMFLGEMLYVQSIVEKLVNIFEKMK